MVQMFVIIIIILNINNLINAIFLENNLYNIKSKIKEFNIAT